MSSTKKSTTATTARSTGTSSSYTRKRKKMDPSVQKYYAVRAGKNPGVYLTWVECQSQTAGYRGAQCTFPYFFSLFLSSVFLGSFYG